MSSAVRGSRGRHVGCRSPCDANSPRRPRFCYARGRTSRRAPLTVERIELPSPAPGTRRHLLVHRFGRPGARPKAYLQAGIHADELPGVAILVHLLERLEALEAAGAVRGEVVVVPVANPVGLAQSVMGQTLGRYDLGQMSNFNRGWPELGGALADRVRE